MLLELNPSLALGFVCRGRIDTGRRRRIAIKGGISTEEGEDIDAVESSYGNCFHMSRKN